MFKNSLILFCYAQVGWAESWENKHDVRLWKRAGWHHKGSWSFALDFRSLIPRGSVLQQPAWCPRLTSVHSPAAHVHFLGQFWYLPCGLLCIVINQVLNWSMSEGQAWSFMADVCGIPPKYFHSTCCLVMYFKKADPLERAWVWESGGCVVLLCINCC